MPAAATARLEARISPELHAHLKCAAELQGRTLTDFVVAAVQGEWKEAGPSGRKLCSHQVVHSPSQNCCTHGRHAVRTVRRPAHSLAFGHAGVGDLVDRTFGTGSRRLQGRLAIADDGNQTARLPALGQQRRRDGLRWLLGARRGQCETPRRPASRFDFADRYVDVVAVQARYGAQMAPSSLWAALATAVPARRLRVVRNDMLPEWHRKARNRALKVPG